VESVCGWVCGGFVWVGVWVYECGVCGCVRVCGWVWVYGWVVACECV
jgi:hypothetical protein